MPLHRLSLAGACILLALLSATIVRADDPYVLAFSDEFDTPRLNLSLWQTTIAFIGRSGSRQHNPYYLSYITDEDITLESGVLRLRADRRPVIGEDPAGLFEFSQGLVSTHDRFSFKYGYVEVRAKVPPGRGIWPTIWLMPDDPTLWPPEFDIAEYYGGSETIRFGLASGTMIDPKWDDFCLVHPTLQEDWHVYGFIWEPKRAVWLLDGEVKLEVSGDQVPDCSMYLILNNAVSSRFGPSGEPNEKTVFPNFFDVDYVRVYQRRPPLAGP